MMKAAVAIVTAAFASLQPVPAPRSQPLRAVVVSLSPYTPRCPDLHLAGGLQFRNAEAWIADPYSYWLVIDANGQLVSSLQQLLLLHQSQLRVWSDRNRNGLIDPNEARPFLDVVAKIDPVATRVDGSYVCRASSAIEIVPAGTKGFHPAAKAAQAAWEIEITTDAAEAEFRYGTTPVEGATASMTRSGDQYLVQVTNARQSPIVALSVSVDGKRGGLGYSHDMYRTERRQNTKGEWSGPVLPGETRTVALGKASEDDVMVVIRGVLFEDMRFEGRHEVRMVWLRERDNYAASLEEWLPVLRAAVQERDAALSRQMLEDKLAERRARIPAESLRIQADGIIEQLVPRAAAGGAHGLEFFVQRFERELALATRHRTAK